MEIINLLLMLGGFYLFYNIGLILKLLLFFVLCISTSLLSNDDNLKKVIEHDKKYNISEPIIKYSKITYNFVYQKGEWFIKLPVVSNIYQYLEFLNSHFVKGRNILLLKAGERVLKSSPISVPETKFIDEKPKIKDDNVFKNKEEMMLFLDELLEKNK